MNISFEFLPQEKVGFIELSDKVRVSDPCYDIDTGCAGTLENVLPGRYACFLQRTDMDDWGVRIANIEVRHMAFLHIEPTELQDIDVGVDSGQCGIYDLDYFIEARKGIHGEDKWYDRVCGVTGEYIDNPDYVPFEESSFWKEEFIKVKQNVNQVEDIRLIDEYFEAQSQYNYSKEYYRKLYRSTANTLDDKCLVSSSGDGDGSYSCYVGRNEAGQIVSIKIDYYYGYGEEDYDEEEEYFKEITNDNDEKNLRER